MATIAQDKFTESNFTGQTISELPDRPNQAGMSAADLKARFDNIGKVLIALGKHNSLIDHLLATTDGSSGGDSIGMTAIPGVSGTTAQAVAESLKALIDATVIGQIPDDSLAEIKMANEMKKDVAGGVASYDLVSTHSGNSNNPHGVTKTQVGLGNVTNESKTTMFTSPNFTGTPTVSDNMMYHVGNITISTTAPGAALAEGFQHQVY